MVPASRQPIAEQRNRTEKPSCSRNRNHMRPPPPSPCPGSGQVGRTTRAGSASQSWRQSDAGRTSSRHRRQRPALPPETYICLTARAVRQGATRTVLVPGHPRGRQLRWRQKARRVVCRPHRARQRARRVIGKARAQDEKRMARACRACAFLWIPMSAISSLPNGEISVDLTSFYESPEED